MTTTLFCKTLVRANNVTEVMRLRRKQGKRGAHFQPLVHTPPLPTYNTASNLHVRKIACSKAVTHS